MAFRQSIFWLMGFTENKLLARSSLPIPNSTHLAKTAKSLLPNQSDFFLGGALTKCQR
jgi:hypothetical protein